MKKILLIGAGSAGQKVAKEFKENKNYEIIGFMDSDKRKFWKKYEGISVIGDHKYLEEFLNSNEIDEILITSTDMSSKEKDKIYQVAKIFKVEVKHLPEIEELKNEEEFSKQLQKLNIPLSVPNLSLDIVENVRECVETGWVSTGGRFITEFEEKIAEYVGVKEAVGVQSGSAGLHIAYRVMGVETGDEVICPTTTFIATVNPIMYIGALPVFMDCDDTLNMDLDKLEEFLNQKSEIKDLNGEEVTVNKESGRKIKAICIVHVFGNPIDMDRVIKIAKKYKLKVIEDSAESLGSYYIKDGEKIHTGTIGDIGIFSFNANKILTTGGGGMVVAKDKEILDKVRFLSVQAKTDPLYFTHDEIGYNYRLTNVAAAFGVSQMKQLEEFVETKIKNYNLYKEAIKDIDGLEILPFNEGTRANHWFYSIMIDKDKFGIDRDELLVKLNECGIQSRPLWGLMHDQKPLKNYEAYKIEKARYYVDNLLNIPCSSNLTEEQVEAVIGKLKEFKK